MALSDLYGKILAMGVDTIRSQTSLPSRVNHVSEGKMEAKRKGGTVEVVVPPEFVTRDVFPASTPPASQGAPAPTTVSVPLNFFKEVNIPLTQTQITQLESADPSVGMFISNAVGPIVEDITASIAANYKGIYGIAGTAGTTPFASSPTAIQTARKILTRQKCPKFGRQVVCNTDAYANAIGLQAFRAANEFGSNRTVREGEIDRAYGFGWLEDVGLDEVEHVTGAAGTVLVDQADVAVGDTGAHLDGLTTVASVGDVFTVAGDSQTYAIKTASALVGTDSDVTFTPPARVAWPNNAAVTFVASHAISLAFNRFAFAFDSRPHERLQMPGVSQVFETWFDEQSGVTLRLEIRNEYHQTAFYLSCLWGTALVDARLACRLLG